MRHDAIEPSIGSCAHRSVRCPFGESVVTELPLSGSLEFDDSRFLTIVARTETEGFSLVSSLRLSRPIENASTAQARSARDRC